MTAAKGKREQNKEANRKAILEAAHRCFFELGYDGVTIRDVIRATHLASGTFYNYFPDKESLFLALIEERMGVLTERISAVRRAARTLEAFLHGAYTTAFEEICAHPDFYAMMFRNEPIIRGLYSDNVMGLSMKALRDDLGDAVKRGLLPEMNVNYLTAIFFGAGYELARMLSEQKGASPTEAAAFATRLFLGGVQQAGEKTISLIKRGPIKLDGAAR